MNGVERCSRPPEKKISSPRNAWEIENESRLEMPGDEDLYKSDFFFMSRPVIEIQRIFGRLPYYIKSGAMKTDRTSFTFAYTVIFFVANLVIFIAYRTSFSSRWRSTKSDFSFKSLIVTLILLLQAPSMVLLVFEWFVQAPVTAENYNRTAILEKNMYATFPAMKLSQRTRRRAAILLSIVMIVIIISTLGLIRLQLTDLPWIPLVSIASTLLISQTHIILWCYSCLYIRSRAAQLRQQMLTCLKQREQRAENLRFCLRFWVGLLKCSKTCLDSVAWSLMFMMGCYAVVFVTSTYGIVVSVMNSEWDGVEQVFPYFILTAIVMLIITEVSYRSKHQMSEAFLQSIVRQDVSRFDLDSTEELDQLARTILNTDRASMSLKGFMNMDRELFVSFLSYALTYVVVLLQFNNAEREKSSNEIKIPPTA